MLHTPRVKASVVENSGPSFIGQNLERSSICSNDCVFESNMHVECSVNLVKLRPQSTEKNKKNKHSQNKVTINYIWFTTIVEFKNVIIAFHSICHRKNCVIFQLFLVSLGEFKKQRKKKEQDRSSCHSLSVPVFMHEKFENRYRTRTIAPPSLDAIIYDFFEPISISSQMICIWNEF